MAAYVGDPQGARCAPVSVVIPCFNCAATIERAVDSVAGQSLVPAEVILVDDGSSDATFDVLHSLRSRYRSGWIKVLAHPLSRGPGSARNTGWLQASQAYIAFLDSDDSWHPQKIELQYEWMCRNPQVPFCAHGCHQVSDGHGQHTSFGLDAFVGVSVSLASMLVSNRFPTRAVMLRTDVGHRFLEGKRYSEDYLLWLQITAKHGPGAYAPVPLAYMYKAAYGEGGLSSRLWQMTKGELHAFSELARSGHIAYGFLGFLYPWSILKHVKRLVVRAWRLN